VGIFPGVALGWWTDVGALTLDHARGQGDVSADERGEGLAVGHGEGGLVEVKDKVLVFWEDGIFVDGTAYGYC
jgi:nitrous oxidase accessory protein NosD